MLNKIKAFVIKLINQIKELLLALVVSVVIVIGLVIGTVTIGFDKTIELLGRHCAGYLNYRIVVAKVKEYYYG